MPAYNKIILKNSSVAGAVPQAAFLEYGEVALNYTDGLLFYKNNDNQIKIYGQDDAAVMPTPHTVVKRDDCGSAYVTSLITVPKIECPFVGVTAKSINTYGATSDTITGTYSHGFLGDGRLKLTVDRDEGALTWFTTQTAGVDTEGNDLLIDVPFSIVRPAQNKNSQQLFISTLPNRSGTLAVADTVDGFIETTSILGLRDELDNIALDISSLQLIISETPEFYPTGKTIFVDSVTGNDTRGVFSKYAESFPFKTIEAAVAASTADSIVIDGALFQLLSDNITVQVNLQDHGLTSGKTISVSGNENGAFNVIGVEISVIDKDNFTYQIAYTSLTSGSGLTTITVIEGADLVYVRNGKYNISNQIDLKGKANIYFESGTDVTVSAPSAFLLTVNENKQINGQVKFTMLNSSALISQGAGSISIQLKNIVGTTNGTLFQLYGSASCQVEFDSIEASGADAFELLGSSSLQVKKSHSIDCKRLINCNTQGTVVLDLWSVDGSSTNSTVLINKAGKFSYRGVYLNNSATKPCITFTNTDSVSSDIILQNLRLSSADTAIVCDNNSETFHSIYLDAIKINTSDDSKPSIRSTNKKTRLYSISTYANTLPDATVSVDGQYNILPKIF